MIFLLSPIHRLYSAVNMMTVAELDPCMHGCLAGIASYAFITNMLSLVSNIIMVFMLIFAFGDSFVRSGPPIINGSRSLPSASRLSTTTRCTSLLKTRLSKRS